MPAKQAAGWLAAWKQKLGRQQGSEAEAEPATGWETVWSDELDDIAASRTHRLAEDAPAPVHDPVLEDRARRMNLIGLAFSGGGIRSATFNLGILQALSRDGFLRCPDYLSTVSGGGYIGSWLTAWVKRTDIPTVESQLEANDAPPVEWLRRFSNYLTPHTGFLSADTWTMSMTWLRNTLLNLSTLICLFVLVLLAPRLLHIAQRMLEAAAAAMPAVGSFRGVPVSQFAVICGILAALLLACVAVAVGRGLQLMECSPSDDDRKTAQHEDRFLFGEGGVQWLVVLPLFVLAWMASTGMWIMARLIDNEALYKEALVLTSALAAFVIAYLLFVAATLSGFLSCYGRITPPTLSLRAGGLGLLVFITMVCGSAAAGMFYALGLLFYRWRFDPIQNSWHVTAWGPSLALQILILTAVLQVGLMGRWLPDDRREWWSRTGAFILLHSLAVNVLFATSIYGPLMLAWLATSWAATGSAVTTWAVTSLGGLLAGKSSRTGSAPDERGAGRSSLAWEALAHAGPYVFMSGFLLAIAGALNLLVPAVDCQFLAIPCGAPNAPATGCLAPNHVLSPYCAQIAARIVPTPALLVQNHWALLSGPESSTLLLLLGGFGVLLALLVWRIDINEFSMHQFYRNRLIRCYLGASHINRSPHPFTGFDRFDDFRLARFQAKPNYVVTNKLIDDKPYYGPYPIINAAFNFTHGDDLAWQERKATSFVFTPKYSGYQPRHALAVMPKGMTAFGYRPTNTYAYSEKLQPAGIHIGTAMAISGAAVSPNMGYHTSTAIAFLLTTFNVRLGWWLGNPRHSNTWRNSGPLIGLAYLVAELFGYTREFSKYAYLSDGGHFENLGIYELARRRCRLIIACDAEEDAGFTFGGLGNAIRKCRTDLGAFIDIDVGPIRDRDANGRSRSHYAIGTVHYPEDPVGSPSGRLLYIKSSLSRDREPQDVLEYQARQQVFPHQSTGDQFFDESQFESYRALGFHIAEEIRDKFKLDKRFAAEFETRIKDFERTVYRYRPRAAGAH